MNEAKKIDIEEAGERQFGAKELLRIKIVTATFHTLELYTSDETSLPRFSYDSRFARSVKALTPLLWPITPDDFKKRINELNQECRKEEDAMLAKDPNMSDSTKKLAFVVNGDRYAAEIFHLLELALVNSPIMQSAENVNIAGEDVSIADMISNIRSDVPLDPDASSDSDVPSDTDPGV